MNRESMLSQIKNSSSQWDVLVIGGGASGLGVALESASRGYKTLLLEQADFAQGTSSRSTKLIHGGLRYLRQGQLGFVRSSLQERGHLLRNAPHLVRPLPFILPTNGYMGLLYNALGIKLYDLLAGKLNIGSSEMLSAAEIKRRLPSVDPNSYTGGIGFFDAQFDDARLAINLAQTIVDLGSTVLNYMPVVDLLKEKGKVVGVRACDLETQNQYVLHARVVVNATGAFVDSLRCLDDPDSPPCLTFSQGSHIVLDRAFFPGNSAVIIPKTSEGRLLFIIPWHQRVLIGTTETPLEVNSLNPLPTQQEIDYLLAHSANYLCKRPRPSDICSVFAGIRALVKPEKKWKSSHQIKREHAIIVSRSQLVSLAGGKWTTFRKMGEETVDVAAKVAELTPQISKTKQLRIHGWVEPLQEASEWQYYGSDAPLVEKLGNNLKELMEPLHPALPCRSVDVIWAVRHEMARCVDDVLARRNRSLLLGAAESSAIASHVAAIMAKELQCDKQWETAQVAAFQKIAKGYCSG